MSPTVLRELNRVNRAIKVRLTDDVMQEYGIGGDYFCFQTIQEAGLYPRLRAGKRIDALMTFKGIRPYERHMEEMEREMEARDAAGGREVCPECGERKLVSQNVKTLGVPGRAHPGDEYSVYRKCEACGHGEL